MSNITSEGVYLTHDEYQKISNTHNNMSDETKLEFKFLKELFGEKFKTILEKLENIEIQTIKTNGNVKKLQLWKSAIAGGLSVFVIFISLFTYIYNLNNNYFKERIEKLEQKISQYDQIIIKE